MLDSRITTIGTCKSQYEKSNTRSRSTVNSRLDLPSNYIDIPTGDRYKFNVTPHEPYKIRCFLNGSRPLFGYSQSGSLEKRFYEQDFS